MFWKKSDEYNHLSWKLARYVTIPFRGSEEYLPVKSDLSNMSKKELEKFKDKEIYSSINITKGSIEMHESNFEKYRKIGLEYEPTSILIEAYEDDKEKLKLKAKL